jgi:RNA polymerase sigma-70 factor (ECF subfamily)
VVDFTKIYDEYFQNVYKYVYSLCHNESIAEEITQEVFFKVLKNIDKFNGDCHLFTWICQIAKNTYFSFYKKQKKIHLETTIPDVVFQEDSLENLVLDKDQARRLHILLHDLPEPYKEVFTLRVFGELPFSQIGELFNKKDSWARLIFYRAKTELRRRLDEDNM